MSRKNMGGREQRIRAKVSNTIKSDSVVVNCDGDTTEISLLYHEPERNGNVLSTSFGAAVTLGESYSEELMAEILDEIQQVTSPDQMDVEDKNGYFEVTLTYEDGNEW